MTMRACRSCPTAPMPYALRLGYGGATRARPMLSSCADYSEVALARLTSRRGHDKVRVSHVRAHARIPGNETVDRLAKRAAQDETFAGDGPDVTEMAQNEYDQATTARSGADDLRFTSAPNPTHPSAATPPTSAHLNLPVVAHALGVG